MYRKITQISLVLIVLISFALINIGCEEDDADPQMVITSKVKGVTQNYHPAITVTVKNISSDVAYSVGCSFELKDGNTIVGDGYCSFPGSSSISPDESTSVEVRLSDVDSHDDYATVIYKLSWYDEHNVYYSKNYTGY